VGSRLCGLLEYSTTFAGNRQAFFGFFIDFFGVHILIEPTKIQKQRAREVLACVCLYHVCGGCFWGRVSLRVWQLLLRPECVFRRAVRLSAHIEVSTRSVLTTLMEYHPKRLICVYGGGGNRSKLRRYDMGEVTGEMADLCVLTCDNPRDEEIRDINNDIKVGLAKSNGKYIEIDDRKEAIAYCMVNAQPGDMIVLLGKGHEDYQEIRGVKYHFDEREAVAEILEEIKEGKRVRMV